MKKKIKVQKKKMNKKEAGARTEDMQSTGLPCEKSALCRLDVKIGYACCAAAEISGDAAISCGLPGGSRALILSDGMGKGIKAAAGSRLVVSRLRKNLKEGMPVARAIKEVNRYMIEHSCEAGNEDFATVDLTVIDPGTGRAKFYKMGAATSFVVRKDKVRLIAQAALPVGIVPTLRLTHISARLRPGDIIVMVSDGITEADRNDLEAEWLVTYLSDIGERPAGNVQHGNLLSPRRLAAEILQQAMLRYDGREQDDLTVAVCIIEEKVTADSETTQ